MWLIKEYARTCTTAGYRALQSPGPVKSYTCSMSLLLPKMYFKMPFQVSTCFKVYFETHLHPLWNGFELWAIVKLQTWCHWSIKLQWILHPCGLKLGLSIYCCVSSISHSLDCSRHSGDVCWMNSWAWRESKLGYSKPVCSEPQSKGIGCPVYLPRRNFQRGIPPKTCSSGRSTRIVNK